MYCVILQGQLQADKQALEKQVFTFARQFREEIARLEAEGSRLRAERSALQSEHDAQSDQLRATDNQLTGLQQERDALRGAKMHAPHSYRWF
jgi:phage shock protein A